MPSNSKQPIVFSKIASEILQYITKATDSCECVNRWLVDFEDYEGYDLSINKERGYDV